MASISPLDFLLTPQFWAGMKHERKNDTIELYNKHCLKDKSTVFLKATKNFINISFHLHIELKTSLFLNTTS